MRRVVVRRDAALKRADPHKGQKVSCRKSAGVLPGLIPFLLRRTVHSSSAIVADFEVLQSLDRLILPAPVRRVKKGGQPLVDDRCDSRES